MPELIAYLEMSHPTTTSDSYTGQILWKLQTLTFSGPDLHILFLYAMYTIVIALLLFATQIFKLGQILIWSQALKSHDYTVASKSSIVQFLYRLGNF